MITIGTFSPTDAGGFNGAIRTLNLQGKVAIVPATERGAEMPDYAVFLGRERLGVAWRRPNDGGFPVLHVRLEHPSFAEPVDAELVAQDPHGRVYSLTWGRDRPDAPLA